MALTTSVPFSSAGLPESPGPMPPLSRPGFVEKRANSESRSINRLEAAVRSKLNAGNGRPPPVTQPLAP